MYAIRSYYAGALLGLARVYGGKWIYRLVTAYIEVVRGTPLITQVFFIYFGLGDIGILLKPVLAAGLALGINTAAYQAEYFRRITSYNVCYTKLLRYPDGYYSHSGRRCFQNGQGL